MFVGSRVRLSAIYNFDDFNIVGYEPGDTGTIKSMATGPMTNDTYYTVTMDKKRPNTWDQDVFVRYTEVEPL